MQVKWLAVAVRNLEAKAGYLATVSPASARAFLKQLTPSVKQLSRHPHLGRPGRVLGTHELVIAGFPCISPYRIRENTVEILRAFPAARAWPDST